jgi:predicted phosphoribosyltransferase
MQFAMLGRRDAIAEVNVRAGTALLRGTLAVPPAAVGLVIFAHGSGSYRTSPRSKYVAQALRARGLATLSVDLFNDVEDAVDRLDGALRFDIDLLADRIVEVAAWVAAESTVVHLPVAYFATNTLAAAALVAAARRPELVRAVVSCAGRADLAGSALAQVHAPVLFAVGGADSETLELDRSAIARMTVPTQLAIVPGASKSFEEHGALDEVAQLAAEWIVEHFARSLGDTDPARAFGRQFHDRRAAGARLATMLEHHAGTGAIVFGLPRNGLPVADAIAYALDAPLDVWLASKIGMPIQPDLGMGALAEGAALVLDPAIVRWSGSPPHELLELVHRKGAEIRRRARHYRDGRAPLDIRGRTAILVDEGIATPSLLRAAIRGARKRGAAHVVVAAPVAASDAVASLRIDADEVVCLAQPHHLIAVGAWYEDHHSVGEHEAIEILRAAREREPHLAAG